MERRDVFILEQDLLVRNAIRSLMAWKASIDWVTLSKFAQSGFKIFVTLGRIYLATVRLSPGTFNCKCVRHVDEDKATHETDNDYDN